MKGRKKSIEIKKKYWKLEAVIVLLLHNKSKEE